MRTTTATTALFATAFFTAVAIAACANSDGGADSTAADAGGTGPTSYGDSGAADSAPKVCPSSCATDQDCQNACPTPSTGTSCCDTQTKACYTASGACPAPADDDAGITPAY